MFPETPAVALALLKLLVRVKLGGTALTAPPVVTEAVRVISTKTKVTPSALADKLLV